MLTSLSIVVSIAVGLVVLIAVGTLVLRVRTRRVAASRPGEGYDQFRASFEPDEAPPYVVWTVYAKLQEWCSDAVAAFPVRASDDVGDIYGLAEEDLDDAVMEVLEECGRTLPAEDQLRRMRPMVTVRDFVLFVAGCPEAAEPVAAADRPRDRRLSEL